MKRALLGALLVAAGIAALIVAARHHPIPATDPNVPCVAFENCHHGALGFSTTAYDLVRVGGLGLIVFGVVIVVFALVRELRHAPGPAKR